MTILVAVLVCVAASAGATPNPPKDASLQAADYVRLGMPAPDREWSPRDYQAAARVLEQIASEEPTWLPRHGSPNSGRVFARLVAAENLAILRSPFSPVETRVALAGDFGAGIRAALHPYFSLASRNVILDQELAEFMGIMMTWSMENADLVATFMRTIPADDPKMKVRSEGLRKVRAGLNFVLSGALESLLEKNTYGREARRSLAAHFEVSAPRLAAHQTELQRAELRLRLAAMAETEPDPSVQASLSSALRAIGAESKPAPP